MSSKRPLQCARRAHMGVLTLGLLLLARTAAEPSTSSGGTNSGRLWAAVPAAGACSATAWCRKQPAQQQQLYRGTATRYLLAEALLQTRKKSADTASSSSSSSSKGKGSASTITSKTPSTSTPTSSPKLSIPIPLPSIKLQAPAYMATKPWAKADDTAKMPAKPVTALPGEVLPAELQTVSGQQATNSSGPVVLMTETVLVSIVLQAAGVAPVDIKFLVDSITATTAALSGTDTAQWVVHNSTLQQHTAALAGNRRLQQQGQTYVKVELSLLTTNPQLVVYRLTQAPMAASPTGAASSSVQANCVSEYCSRLAAAGIPVDSNSIHISPVYDFGSSGSDPAAAAAARDAAVARSRTLGLTIGVCVAASVVFLLLLCNARRIISCWRCRTASVDQSR